MSYSNITLLNITNFVFSLMGSGYGTYDYVGGITGSSNFSTIFISNLTGSETISMAENN